MRLRRAELKEFLDEKARHYEQNWLIEDDPISIPHQLSNKEDVEIAAFLTATIAWGQRKTIINNAQKLLEMMDRSPHSFLMNHSEKDLKPFESFVHRTFNGDDLLYFISALRHIYKAHGGLENAFSQHPTDMQQSIAAFKLTFFSLPHLPRTQKHVSDPMKKSTAKRLNMFLRWMVRSPQNGVDFGLWSKLDPSHLMLPLDVHTASVSRKLNLLKRKQNDWNAVEELTANLRKMDATDPTKYDFALFGIGAYEKHFKSLNSKG